MNRSRAELVTIVFLLLFVAGSLYIVVALAIAARVNFMLLTYSTLAFFIFAVLHANMTLGTECTLVFLLISFCVSLVFELLGTGYGLIFGTYYYTDRLGPKILGLVPALIPLAWFMMVYASYTLANLLAPPQTSRKSILHFLWLVFLSSVIMTSWDLINDPINVNGGHWVWPDGGPYFGIPISNFVGWLTTTFVIYLLYRLYENWRRPERAPIVWSSFALLPIMAYGVTMIANVAVLIVTGHPAPAMVGLFSMGAFLAAAISKLVHQSL